MKIKTDMKKIILTTAFALLLIFLSSCLTTLHPIFTEKDLAYDSKLIGTWSTENEGKKGKVIISNLATESSLELPRNISAIKQQGYFIIYKDENGKTSEQCPLDAARHDFQRRHVVRRARRIDLSPADRRHVSRPDRQRGHGPGRAH